MSLPECNQRSHHPSCLRDLFSEILVGKRKLLTAKSLNYAVFLRIRARFASAFVFGVALLAKAGGQAFLAIFAGTVAARLGNLSGIAATARPSSDFFSLIFASFGLQKLAALSLGAIVLKTLGSAITSYVVSREVGLFGVSIRGSLLARLLVSPETVRHSLRLPRQGDHGPHEPSSALSLLTTRVREVEEGVHGGTFRCFMAAVELICLVLSMLAVSPRLSVWAGLFFLVVGVPIARARRGSKAQARRSLSANDAVLEQADQAVHALDLLRVFGAGTSVIRRLRALGVHATRATAAIAARAALLSGANELAAGSGLLLLIMLSTHVNFGVAPDLLLRFFVVMVLCYRPLRDLSDGLVLLARAQIAWISLEPPFEPALHEPSVRGWPMDTLALEGWRLPRSEVPISLTLPHGSVLVLRGSTGTGKTTLFRTMLGLSPSLKGRLCYGERVLDDDASGVHVGVGPSERPFAWLPQEANVVFGTVRDNVRLSDDNALSAESLKLLPARPEESLSVSNRLLSGGERQLVGLARALESNAPVLLLDEPTAALDPETEAMVLQVLKSCGRTLLIITHRDAVCRIATHMGQMESGGAVLVRRCLSAELPSA
jgi:ABC-type multidrug transport system fused ATPase/permease subunit